MLYIGNYLSNLFSATYNINLEVTKEKDKHKNVSGMLHYKTKCTATGET